MLAQALLRQGASAFEAIDFLLCRLLSFLRAEQLFDCLGFEGIKCCLGLDGERIVRVATHLVFQEVADFWAGGPLIPEVFGQHCQAVVHHQGRCIGAEHRISDTHDVAWAWIVAKNLPGRVQSLFQGMDLSIDSLKLFLCTACEFSPRVLIHPLPFIVFKKLSQSHFMSGDKKQLFLLKHITLYLSTTRNVSIPLHHLYTAVSCQKAIDTIS